MELDVDTLIHESGAAQLEVNFQHADPMSRADQVFLFKRTMREAAMRHGIYATFLAKPMENEPGSSMHIHQSMVDAKTGKNVFAGKQGTASTASCSSIISAACRSTCRWRCRSSRRT